MSLELVDAGTGNSGLSLKFGIPIRDWDLHVNLGFGNLRFRVSGFQIQFVCFGIWGFGNRNFIFGISNLSFGLKFKFACWILIWSWMWI